MFNYLKMLASFFLLFLLIPVVFASVNDYDSLELKIDNSISFKTEIQEDFSVSQFAVTSYFYPQEIKDSQELTDFTSSHEDYEVLEDKQKSYLRFHFDESSLRESVLIENTFRLNSQTHHPKISTKHPYPIPYVSAKNRKYLDFLGFIDSDDAIKTRASALAAGEDDVFVIAAKVAKWIREDINYNLSTVTENPDQSSTEVFQSKSGVCREITNLFISMMRELGIPARVVTGYAYTENEDVSSFIGSNWGGHAWAEVLIGDTWVPFDLTYDQYGYVDASHIILDRSREIRENTVILNGTGRGFQLVSGSLTTSSTFGTSDRSNTDDEQNIKLELSGPQELGFGSHGYLKATVSNNNDYYNIAFLNIAKPEEISTLNTFERMVPLKPQEKKEIYFRYRLPEDLDPNFQYTFPFQAYGSSFSKNFTITSQESFTVLGEAALPVSPSTKKEQDFSKELLAFRCDMRPLKNGNNEVSCNFRNQNNFEVKNLTTCLDGQKCQQLSLRLNEERTVKFSTEKQSAIVSYTYGNVSEQTSSTLDEPTLAYEVLTKDNEVTLSYNLSTYYEGLSVSVVKDGKELATGKSQAESLRFELPEGSHNLSIRLMSFNRSITETSREITTTAPEEVTVNEEETGGWFRSFITAILGWF